MRDGNNRFLLLAQLYCGVIIAVVKGFAATGHGAPKSSFYFVQVTDPQFGVKNAYGSSWEEAMDWSQTAATIR